MQEFHVLSNKNSSVFWWKCGANGETVEAIDPPAEYLEITEKHCFYPRNPGLYIYATADGACCSLANAIPSGKSGDGSSFLESLLIVGDDKWLTGAMKGLAYLYLADPPLRSEDALGVEGIPPEMGRLMNFIEQSGTGVRVHWDRLVTTLESSNSSVAAITAAREHAFLRPDTAANRESVIGLIAGSSAVAANEVLVAVSPGMPVEKVKGEVRWGLTDTIDEAIPAAALPLNTSEPKWLWWAAVAMLTSIALAAAFSVNWRRH